MHYWKPPYPGLSNAFNCKPTVKITLSTEQHWWKSGVDALRDTVSVKTPWVLLSAIMTFHTDSCFSSVTAAALSHQPAAHLITGERERSVVLFQTLVRHLTVYGGLLTRDLNALKGSYDAFLKIIILCIWCNRMLLTCFNVQKYIIFQILFIIVGPLCPASLQRVIFYKVPPSDKRRLLWLANRHSELRLAEHCKHSSEI